MVKIGITICPEMTRDANNPVYCRVDCAQFCDNPDYILKGHDGYCGKNVLTIES